MAFGGLGITLAGFAGLISALDRAPGGSSAIANYRIRNIVVLGFWLAFTGLGTVALYGATSDVTLAVRVGTAFLSLRFVRGLMSDTRPGPAWPVERERRFGVLLLVLMFAACVPNFAMASPGYLQLLMIMGLIGPVTIFYNTIRDNTRQAATAAMTDAGSDPT